MGYVVGNWILVDRPGRRDGNLHDGHARHGVLLLLQGMRRDEAA
jgi:hypothetical protein